MFLGCGVAAYSAAVFHLMTHAFFKALLFLAAGSVIHGLGGEQNLLKMGGLRKKLPITFWTMTAGVFAIAGFFPFAGFFSKDAILYEAFQHGALGKSLYFVGLVTALLTSFYMFRLWYLAFFGESRAEDHSHHPHESPWSMLTPLVILALLSVAGGWIGIERFGNFLAPVVGPVIDPALEPGGKHLDFILSFVAVAVAALGWFIAHLFYSSKNKRAENLAAATPGVYNLLAKKYAIDELYSATIVQPILLGSRYILGWIGEGAIIRGSAWLLAGITTLLGEWLRRWQSGNLRSYSAWIAAAVAVLLLAALFLGSRIVPGFDTNHVLTLQITPNAAVR
jgi:NADH-quinone oxidoreductase subunit L